VLAGCAALTGALLCASPAHAAYPIEDREQVDFTFTWQGQSVTCTVVGTSSYALNGTTYRYSQYSATTAVVDTDPACGAAVIGTGVQMVLSRPRASVILIDYADADDDHVSLAGTLGSSSPVPTNVSALHVARFACDDFAGECDFQFNTAPK
jgi:hypothetical protein